MVALLLDYGICRVCGETKPREREHFVVDRGTITRLCRVCHRRRALEQKRRMLSDPALRARREEIERRYRKNEKGRKAAKRHRVHSSHKYRQKRAGQDKSFVWSYAEWMKTLDRFDHACVYCGERDCELTQDHFVPLAAHDCPGTVPWNMVPACRRCNSRKCARRPEELYTDAILEPIVGILIRVADEHEGVRDGDTPF